MAYAELETIELESLYKSSPSQFGPLSSNALSCFATPFAVWVLALTGAKEPPLVLVKHAGIHGASSTDPRMYELSQISDMLRI